MNDRNRGSDRKILLFLCNWGAHAAFLTLQDQPRPLPDEFLLVRTPCTVRTAQAMLLQAFPKGADIVLLVVKEPVTCRYR